ncbi:acyltransferase family protein [Clostridium sp. AL.422]|uniref:acyltransferase family protein n=1 Tax=Clostridium TaxID=1485 RepID=UPI00293DAC4E|nr:MULTISPECIES: acyltransferase family protein [unclassified Clostridium]MDV4150288.1 acyltransferase family protein [Clostridium sp. AL.422]
MNKDRLLWIDVMKGLGITLVLMGHVSQNELLTNWIFSFHMPMFFFISGITFYISSKKSFIKKKAKTLLTPYFIFSILTLIYWIIIERNLRGDNTTIISQITGLFLANGGLSNYVYNNVMWFLPCLLITEIIFYYFNKFDNKKLLRILCTSSLVGYVLPKLLDFRLPFTLDTMFMAILFYGIGYLFICNEKQLRIKKSLVILICLLINIVSIYFNGRVDMNNNVYGNYILFIIGSLSGIAIIYIISKIYKFKFFSVIGKYSLIIMCIHEPIKRVLIKVISIILKVDIDLARQNVFIIFICTILLLFITIPIAYIIDKYFGILIGKKRKSNLQVLVHN